MISYEPGQFARSLAGRDKGRLYIILKAEGEYVSLTDGKYRPAEKPKRKKKKHVQLKDSGWNGVKEMLIRGETADNAQIRRILKEADQLQ
ncbi:MAG: hypothetical protein HFG51_12240 [Lachnospiraceae bacterium]|nr:hypothetical protein [Lachnospiraceae bacterium]